MRLPRTAAFPLLAFLAACGGGNYADSNSGDGLSAFNGWARREGASGLDGAMKTAVFPDGSVVVTGLFTGEVVFGEGTPDETLLESAGDTDMFVARYTANGTLMWARGAGGPANDEGRDVDIAADGSCFVTGYHKDGAVFGSGEPAEVELAVDGFGESNPFVARYAADGSLMWVASSSSDSFGYGMGVGGLPNGSCVVTGIFHGTFILGPGEPNETTMNTVEAFGVAPFVARYGPDGMLAWARQGVSSSLATSAGLDTLDDGSSLVVGTFSGDLSLGPGPTRLEVEATGGNYSFFVARYDADGVPQWIRAGGLDADFTAGADVAAIPDGTCVVLGHYAGAPTFGPGGINETQLPDSGSPTELDVFFAHYGSGGSLLWARGAGGAGRQVASAIAVHADGSIWITGEFEGGATLGLGEPNQTTLSNSGIFLARLFPDGDLRWAKRVTNSVNPSPGGSPLAGGVAVRSDRSCIVSGSFLSEVEFGIGSFQETLESAGASDAFVARFGPNGEF